MRSARTRRRTSALLAGWIALVGPGAAPLGGQPTTSPAAAPQPAVERGFTLLDPSLALPPLGELAPDVLDAADRPLDDPAPEPAAPPALSWQLAYRRAQLDSGLPAERLRADPSTGFSRQLDRDVLALGMSWRLAGSRVGLGYQLQAARDGEVGLTRFLPNSAAATHAFTLGVSREFGAGAPPPAPLVLLEPVPGATPTAASAAP